ncbi:hypothetical protein E2C01_068973 [Portunus trituberculatus]|uniref:Uncharacterized protein n=1 Tax=Portunus trituberculatus TaxID=210409 RepID=A0A5B7HZD2_PORTR|nr:hypothetical protein [Portunus trituberculatus]
MNAGHFLPELVKVTQCRSQETYTVIQAIQVSINRLTFPLPNVTQALGNRYQGLREQAIGEKQASIDQPAPTLRALVITAFVAGTDRLGTLLGNLTLLQVVFTPSEVG